MSMALAAKARMAGENTAPRTEICRAARPSEIPLVRRLLVEAIAASPFYGERFKSFEIDRLGLDYLEAMHEADPRHLLLVEQDGDVAGFVISGPELGILWLYWFYVIPRHRRRGLARQALAELVAFWDEGQFHKIAAYARPDNLAGITAMRNNGFCETARLESHIFGEDYLLLERKLTKSLEGYDTGLRLGRLAAVMRRFRRLFGRPAASGAAGRKRPAWHNAGR